MSVSVCLFVCLSLRSHISKTTVQTSRNFLYVLSGTVARTFSDNNGTRYVLPVSWMTSIFPVMVLMGVGNISVAAPLWSQVVIISNVFTRRRHAVSLCRRIQWQQNANGVGESLMYTIALFRKNDISNYHSGDKNSSGDEIANANFYAVRPEATRIRWNNAK